MELIFAEPCAGHPPREFVAGACHACGRDLELTIGSALAGDGLLVLDVIVERSRSKVRAAAVEAGVDVGDPAAYAAWLEASLEPGAG